MNRRFTATPPLSLVAAACGFQCSRQRSRAVTLAAFGEMDIVSIIFVQAIFEKATHQVITRLLCFGEQRDFILMWPDVVW